MTDQCSTCFFAVVAGDDYECRVYPPAANTSQTAWPRVVAAQWCGHFSTDGDTVGPAGPQGPQGEQGDTGPTGADGAGSAFVVPLGAMLPFTGTTAPSNFIFPYGQAISRTTYAEYFNLPGIGTTYGVGDGSTTFNVIDMRGRVPAGYDSMGGSSANRLTTPINGDTIGAAGGNESVASSAQTLTGGQHTDTLGDPGAVWWEITSLSATPGAATSVIQPTIIVPYILRVL